MLKKQQKWVALLVVLTFVWLLQVSAMPLTANGSAVETVSAPAEQGPAFVEAAGHKAAPPPKKSILPLVLIGVGVVAVAAVLVLVVFKTSYDIVGSWDFEFTGSSHEFYTLTFTGSKGSGNFVFVNFAPYAGPYAVDGKNVTMTVTSQPTVKFSGQFTGKDTMSGTWVVNNGGQTQTWTWTAKRATGAAVVNPPPTAQSMLFPR
jgi:hypothetical protein